MIVRDTRVVSVVGVVFLAMIWSGHEGNANLAALANTQPRGAIYVRHFITNHVIEPAPGAPSAGGPGGEAATGCGA